MKPGEARLADCLSKQQDDEAKGNTEGMDDVRTPICRPPRQTALTPLAPAAKVCDNFSCMDAGKTLTDDCKKELADFRIELGESINKNLPLGTGQALQ